MELGAKIGRSLAGGCIISFRGGLGAGKTTLTKGIARGLGVEDEVTSPTYTLIQEYRGRLPLFHVDAYRLSSSQDFFDIGGRDILSSDGVCVIEWSENIDTALPRGSNIITISEGALPESRVFQISGPELEAAFA